MLERGATWGIFQHLRSELFMTFVKNIQVITAIFNCQIRNLLPW